MKYLSTIFTVLCLSLSTLTAADNWDDGYRKYQDLAPEYLEIKVEKVALDQGTALYGSNSKVTVEATVTQVFRTATGLAEGSRIFIRYNRKSQAGTMDLEAPILKEGTTLPAFLKKKSAYYSPAALHHSFSPLTPQQLLALSPPQEGKSVNPTVTEEAMRAEEPEPIEAEAVIPVAEKVEPAPVVTTSEVKPRQKAEAVEVATVEVAQPQSSQSAEIARLLETRKEPAQPASRPAAQAAPAVEVETAQPVRVTNPIVINIPDKPQPTPAPTPVKTETAPVKPVKKQPVASTPEPEPAPAPKPVAAPTPPPPPEPKTQELPSPAAVTTNSSQDSEALARYTKVYELMVRADNLFNRNEYNESGLVYHQAKDALKKLKADKPDFQPFLVDFRLNDIERKLQSIEKLTR